MPLITERNAVLDVYAQAAARGWVIPSFCTENLTTTEAVLAATLEHGRGIGRAELPITIALTNCYSHRPQSINYTHTRRWEIGLRLFMADLKVLTDAGSPFEHLRVLVHLDHIQHDEDRELLDQWDMRDFSSIMFDASTLPFEENMAATARFVEREGRRIMIEGACDEVVEATDADDVAQLTTPERAEDFVRRTGADMIVANLGTEHRASASALKYHGGLARRIKKRIGPKIVLHGCSSVTADQIANLFEDGVCKVNIWTMLERDSAPVLLENMVANAAKLVGAEKAKSMAEAGLLGPQADLTSPPMLSHYATVARQEIVFEEIKGIVGKYLGLWYK